MSVDDRSLGYLEGLRAALSWHEKCARYCMEVSRDDPRLPEDVRLKARKAADHHSASIVGIDGLYRKKYLEVHHVG